MRIQEITAISEPSNLKSRHNYQTCVHHIGGNREIYDGHNTLELVILSHHLYARDLQNVIKSPDLQKILKTIVEKNPKFDMYTSWQKYCRTMDPEERAVPTFGNYYPLNFPLFSSPKIITDSIEEGAMYLSAKSILDSKDRERWVGSCQGLLSSLKSLARRDQGPTWQAASTNKVTKRKSYRTTPRNRHKPADLVQRPGSPFEQPTDPSEFNAPEIVGLVHEPSDYSDFHVPEFADFVQSPGTPTEDSFNFTGSSVSHSQTPNEPADLLCRI